MRIAGIFCVLVASFIGLESQCLVAAQPRPAWSTSRVKGSPTKPTPYKVELAYPKLKFDNPKCVVEIPGTNRLLVAHDGSKLVSFPKEKDVETTSLVANLEEIEGTYAGANTVAFHPDFVNNRQIFVAMGHDAGSWHLRVMRYSLTDEAAPTIVPDSGKLIIRWPGGGHSGGCLAFGKDGYLYISTGDGSGPTPPDQRATGQDVSDLLGAVLRIDVDRTADEQNYAVPDDNPFVDLANARPEIWSYGLRNPWKFGIDRETGDVFVADNGWETWEIIHKLHRGSNCGWPIMEGRARLLTDVAVGPTPITPPVKDHPHSEANSVIGGPVYRGNAMRELGGTFVYGDFITGSVWGLKSGSEGEFEHRTLADSDLHIVAFTEGSRGEIYVLDYDTTGQLYELLPSNVKDTSDSFPKRLSQTGIFKNTAELQVADGVVPYSITAEPWMDGAKASRWIAIPGNQSIDLDKADFPDGTVIAKQLSIAKENGSELPVETQLLHYENGSWNPYTYLWNETLDDATLVPPEGQNIEIQLGTDEKSKRTWHASSTNECRMCHNVGSNVVLGLTPRQLDKEGQLNELVSSGVLAAMPTRSYDSQLVDPHDETARLDDRGRSYLHMNCGICHNRNGPATISFYAHRDYEFRDLRITKRPGVGNFGIDEAQLVKPGMPYKSVILYRLAKLGYGRMPYVGSRVVDSRGIGLVEKWIAALDSTSSEPFTSSGSATAPMPDAEIEDALKTTESALALVARMHAGDIPRERFAGIHASAKQSHSDIRGLLDHFLPESERRQTVGQNPDPQSILEVEGVAKRGELIFLSDNARCKSCHDVRDATLSLGPTLADIRKKYERRTDMLTHVLRPSEKIDDKFAAWTVVTDDGDVHVGMLQGESDGTVKLRTADKKVVNIKRGSIEEMKKSERSMMPEGVIADLTMQEAADLLAFLMEGGREK